MRIQIKNDEVYVDRKFYLEHRYTHPFWSLMVEVRKVLMDFLTHKAMNGLTQEDLHALVKCDDEKVRKAILRRRTKFRFNKVGRIKRRNIIEYCNYKTDHMKQHHRPLAILFKK